MEIRAIIRGRGSLILDPDQCGPSSPNKKGRLYDKKEVLTTKWGLGDPMAPVVTHKGRGILSILQPRFNLLTELATFRPRKIIRPNNFVLRHPKSNRGSRIGFSKPASRTSQDPTLYCASPGAPIVRGLGFRVQGSGLTIKLPPPHQQKNCATTANN